jgi:hypothetical protein
MARRVPIVHLYSSSGGEEEIAVIEDSLAKFRPSIGRVAFKGGPQHLVLIIQLTPQVFTYAAAFALALTKLIKGIAALQGRRKAQYRIEVKGNVYIIQRDGDRTKITDEGTEKRVGSIPKLVVLMKERLEPKRMRSRPRRHD